MTLLGDFLLTLLIQSRSCSRGVPGLHYLSFKYMSQVYGMADSTGKVLAVLNYI